MIAGTFHGGSGLGNQLHRYVATRCLALDKGYEFGMFRPELFKGKDFMNLDMGVLSLKNMDTFFYEKCVRDNYNVDIRSFDPEFNFIKDGTVIEGEFQDERYFANYLPHIRTWLKTKETVEMPNDLCVINFRGGEYTFVDDLFLPKEYWETAIKKMKEINPNMEFHVHTDDVITAKKFFPDFEVIKNIEVNWCSIRYARYLILSNSSFGILPALLNENVEKIIAPRYWARYNTKTWALPQNYYKKFSYIHHESDIS